MSGSAIVYGTGSFVIYIYQMFAKPWQIRADSGPIITVSKRRYTLRCSASIELDVHRYYVNKL